MAMTTRGYVGKRLVFANAFRAVAEWKEKGERRWTYVFEDGSTTTIISLQPGEGLG
jgi:hypothetical protein